MKNHYLNFTKNGVYSGDMGVTHVSLSSGLFEESLGGNLNIVEQVNDKTDRRYFKRVSRDPIEFEMILLLEDGMDDTQIESVCKWLFNDYYEELFFEDEVDRIYYCMPISQPKITHNGMNQGYITVQMRCFDSYIYSQEITDTFELTNNTSSGTIISLHNFGHVDIYPILTIKHKEVDVSITNLLTNETLTMSDIPIDEVITIDNDPKVEEITTSAGENVYRYENHNDVFLRIIGMNNQFKVIGKCQLTLTYRYKYKF